MDVNVDKDAVLLIDSQNAFKSINCKIMLHNLKFIYAIIATYIINCYATPSSSFIVYGGEILSSELTTEGEGALGILP